MTTTTLTAHSPTQADPYASRLDKGWEAAPRQDPVIWGGAGPLPADELQEFQVRGFRHDRQLFAKEEIVQMQNEAARLAAAADRRRPGVIVESGSDVIRSIFRLHRENELFRAVSRDPRITRVVRQILGSDIYLHQSRINYKPGFDGKEFFWHSDFETWHVEDGMPRMRAVSVSIALTENTEFNGPLMVVPGSHHTYIRCQGATPENHFEHSLKKQEYGVPSREAMAMLVDDGGIVAPKGPAGASLFFDCNLMHGSAGNLSPFPRTNLFLVYNSVENSLVQPFGDRPPRPEFLAERDIEVLPE